MNKTTLILAVTLIISVVLNLVLIINIKDVSASSDAKFVEQIAQKDEAISSLDTQLKELNDQIINSDPEERENISNTKLEEQQTYKTAAKQFIETYLGYNSNQLDERREKLLSSATEDLVNRIAPPTLEDEEALSSDPTFVAEVREVNTFLSSTDEITNTTEVIADVTYDTSSTEGDVTVQAMVRLLIKSNDDGSIKVTHYDYYPVN